MGTSLYMKSILNKFDKYILITNDNGDIIFSNDKLIKKLNYKKEELYKFNIEDIIVEKDVYIKNILENSKDVKINLSFYSKMKK